MIRIVFNVVFFIMIFTSCSTKSKNTGDTNQTPFTDSMQNVMPISEKNSMYLLVGTYATGDAAGIYVLKLDTLTGKSENVSSIKAINPSYLAISKDERCIYSVAENDDKTGAVSAFSFDKISGKLQFINSQLAGGRAPCYVSIDESGKYVLAANYNGGNITIFETDSIGALQPSSGTIRFSGKGVNELRQTQPHLHYIDYSVDGKYVFATDLGTDKIYKFEVNDDNTGDYLKIGNPAFYKVTDGAGPRHMTFHPNGKNAYLLSEISGTVFVFDYDNGNLTETQTIQADTLQAGGSADIHISPDGKFLYASNRLKGDGIAIFSIGADGKLTKVGYQETGIHPRNFNITPNGKFLLVACRDNDLIQVFERNMQTGLLTNTKQDIQITKPVCVKFAAFR